MLVALMVRLALAVGVQYQVSKTPGRLCLISGDAEGYWELAGKLAAGETYSIHTPPRFLLRMPGFPMLLALPRLIFGDKPFAARIVLALIGTLACGLTYWLGRELAGETVGIIAGVYTAISPTMALFSVLFLSETAFAATMLASLIAAAKLARGLSSTTSVTASRWIRLSLLTGALVGLATLVRPTWILVGPGLAALFLILCPRPIGLRGLLGGLICLGLGLSLAPWTYRNFCVTGHLIATTLWSGPSLYDGLNPTATGDSDMTFFDQEQLMLTMSEYDMNREYRRRAMEFAIANPGRVISLAIEKQRRYWNPAPSSPQFSNPTLSVVGWLTYLPLILLAVVGAWFARGDVWLLILTLAPVLYFAALHLLFVGSLRYRLPAEYPLAVLSAVGLCQLRPFHDRTTT